MLLCQVLYHRWSSYVCEIWNVRSRTFRLKPRQDNTVFLNKHCISIWQPLNIVVQHCCIYNYVTKVYIMQMLWVCLGFILTFCFCDHYFLHSLLHNNYLTIWAVSKWSLIKSLCELLLHPELADELKSQSACDSSDVRTWTCLHVLLARNMLAHLASLHASASDMFCVQA